MTKKDYEMIAQVIKDNTEWVRQKDAFGETLEEKKQNLLIYISVQEQLLAKIILTLIKENFGTLVENLILKIGRNNMIRFTIDCPDKLSAEVFRKVLDESLTKKFLEDLNIYYFFLAKIL